MKCEWKSMIKNRKSSFSSISIKFIERMRYNNCSSASNASCSLCCANPGGSG